MFTLKATETYLMGLIIWLIFLLGLADVSILFLDLQCSCKESYTKQTLKTLICKSDFGESIIITLMYFTESVTDDPYCTFKGTVYRAIQRE